MKLGFTGTRNGMSDAQVRTVLQFLYDHRAKIDYVIHGGCVGADDDFDKLAASLGILRSVFPSDRPKLSISSDVLIARGPCVIHSPDDPLKRNKVIVKHSTDMLACPRQREEVLRSGTWATIRYSRKAGVKLEVIAP